MKNLWLVVLTLMLLYACNKKTTISDQPVVAKVNSMMNANNGRVADSVFKEIDQLIQNRKVEDAEAKLLELKARFESSGDWDAYLRTVMSLCQTKMSSGSLSPVRDYDSRLPNVIDFLRAELTGKEDPVKSILTNLLAGSYASLLYQRGQQNQDITSVVGQQDQDYLTWSLEQLQAETNKLFLASISNEGLSQYPIYSIALITNVDAKNIVSRNIYDFLMIRVLDYMKNPNNFITEPVYKFEIRGDKYFAPIESFIKLNFESQDSISMILRSLQVYQKLLSHYKNSGNDTALYWLANYDRFNFVYQHSVDPNKTEQYLAALNEFIINGKPGNWKALYKWQTIQTRYNNDVYNITDPTSGDRLLLKNLHREATDLINEYRNDDLPGVSAAKEFVKNITATEYSFSADKVQLPDKPFLMLAAYKNTAEVVANIYKLTREDYIALKYNRTRDFDENKYKLIRKLNASVTDPGDLRNHTAEIKVDPLQAGYYLITNNIKNEDNQNYELFQVSSLQAMQGDQPSSNREYILTDRFSGAPLPEVKASLYSINYDGKNNFKLFSSASSDQNGIVRVNGAKHQQFITIFTKNQQELINENVDYYYDEYAIQEKQLNSQIFTDRAIYRPGQTIYFKAIVYKRNKENVPELVVNKACLISLHDVNDQELQKFTLKSNEYGSIQGTFTLPASGLTGTFHINIDGNYGVGFSVEEYKRPTFELSFDTINKIYKLGDKVALKGIAKNYAGVPLTGATVKYTVTRNQFYRWYGFYRYFPERNNNEMVIINGSSTTDEAGNYIILFDALPDESILPASNPLFRFQIHADVTDISGETQSIDKSLTINYKGVDVDYQIQQPADVADLSKFKIKTLNIEGNEIAFKGNLTVEKLRQPSPYLRRKSYLTPEYVMLDQKSYKSLWPYEAYLNEADAQNWQVERQFINTQVSAGINDLNQLAGRLLESGTYRILFTPDGQEKADIKNAFYLTVATDRNSKLFQPGLSELIALNTDKENYAPFESAIIYTVAKNPSSKVFLNASRSGKTIWQKWVSADRVNAEIQKLSHDYLGGIVISAFACGYNDFDTKTILISIPWTEKDLSIQLITFRDKLLPGAEESWQLKISGPDKDKVAAEVLATMYDQSLDVFATKPYQKINFPVQTASKTFSPTVSGAFYYAVLSYQTSPPEQVNFPTDANFKSQLINKYYLVRYRFYREYMMSRDGSPVMSESMVMQDNSMQRTAAKVAGYNEAALRSVDVDSGASLNPEANPDHTAAKNTAPPIRSNLEETVFFYPDLKTDAEGNVYVKFKMKEALTRWLFRVYAHSKSLQQGYIERTVTTSKEIMIFPHLPRYLRENDIIELTAKISSLDKVAGKVNAKLQLINALTDQPLETGVYLDSPQKIVILKAGSSTVVNWKIKSPSLPVEAVKVRITAETDGHQDGEENTLPVIPNRMLVTESMPMNIRSGQTREFDFRAMQQSFASNTMVPYRYTLEYTANPVWYAIQALPYIMEYPYECTEQIVNRYAANALAADITTKFPKIKSIFDRWRNTDALESNLQKNRELKSALLEETPWVLDAKNDESQRKNIAILFDLNRMSAEQSSAAQKIRERQYSNGGFPWFPGGVENEFMTSYVLENIGHLRKLGVASAHDQLWVDLARQAMEYCDIKVQEHYKDLETLYKNQPDELSKNHTDYWVIQYLYARSFFAKGKLPEGNAFTYYYNQIKKYWNQQSTYMSGISATVLFRYGDQQLAKDIMEGLKQSATKSDELGMYWTTQWSWWWYQLPVETQSLMIEAFDEITGDQHVVNELKIWLLKNKQTNHWATTKGTASAIYALMSTGGAPALETVEPDIAIGKQKLNLEKVKQEAGTGYFKMEYQPADIMPEMSKIKIKNNSKVVNWGAAYWQYFEQLDKIKVFKETPLNIQRTFNIVRKTDRGEELIPVDNSPIKVGDRIRVRTIIRVDRPMEYLHLKDMRPAGLEPINNISGYKYKNGLGYYEAPKDVATHFFIDFLRPGTYTFEYDLVASLKGDFSTGISTIQCMYAPEFSSHSEGKRMVIN